MTDRRIEAKMSVGRVHSNTDPEETASGDLDRCL